MSENERVWAGNERSANGEPAALATFVIESGEAGMRLDQYLGTAEFGAFADFAPTRSQIKRIIDLGDVRVNGATVKPSRKVRAGDHIEVVIRPPEPAIAEAQDIPVPILFEDDHLVIVDKPAGLVVHPAPGHPDGTLVNALLHHCCALSGVGGTLRPGIVHRLDKDTSGVMVASKDDATHVALAALFQDKTLIREYVAIVSPAPDRDEGTFSTLFGRHPIHRKKFSSTVARGKRAVTHYRVEERFGSDAALVRCRLETGRTHQIRVHFADAGHPLVGDPIYGHKPRKTIASSVEVFRRQALHAARLEFVHPISGESLRFETKPPPDFQALVTALRSNVVKTSG